MFQSVHIPALMISLIRSPLMVSCGRTASLLPPLSTNKTLCCALLPGNRWARTSPLLALNEPTAFLKVTVMAAAVAAPVSCYYTNSPARAHVLFFPWSSIRLAPRRSLLIFIRLKSLELLVIVYYHILLCLKTAEVSHYCTLKMCCDPGDTCRKLNTQ